MWDDAEVREERHPDAERGRVILDVLRESDAALRALGTLADAARSEDGLAYLVPISLVGPVLAALADTWHLGDLDTFDPDRCRVVAVDIGRGILVVEASGDDWARRTRVF